jgi:hypothetical protein
MPDYVTLAANFEATGAALTPCELATRLIHRPNPGCRTAKEVTPTQTTH